MNDLRPEGLDIENIKGNCGVVATAVVLGIDYPTVEQAFRTLCKRKGNWKGSTHHFHRAAVVRYYGANIGRITIKKGCVRKVCPQLDSGGRYLVRTGGHAMAYIHGKLVDQSGTWDIDHPARARKIVTDVHRVRVEGMPTLNDRIDAILSEFKL